MKPSAIGLELLSALALLSWVRGGTALPDGLGGGYRFFRRFREGVQPRAPQYGYDYGDPPPPPPLPPPSEGSTSGGVTGGQTPLPSGKCPFQNVLPFSALELLLISRLKKGQLCPKTTPPLEAVPLGTHRP